MHIDCNVVMRINVTLRLIRLFEYQYLSIHLHFYFVFSVQCVGLALSIEYNQIAKIYKMDLKLKSMAKCSMSCKIL